MSRKDLIIIDGSQLSAVDSSIPEDLMSGMNAEQFYELAYSRISKCLNDFTLPAMVGSFGFSDLYNFHQLLEEDPQRLLQQYFSVIVIRLKADPIVVSILDGSTIRPYLENEDDFVTFAENLFTDLELNDRGELNTSQIMGLALLHFGEKIGVSRFSDLPIIDDVLKKHEVNEGVEKLDQAQFAQLLKPILQDVVDALALNQLTVLRDDVKFVNGGIIRQLLEEESIISIFTTLLYQRMSDESAEEKSFEEMYKGFLEENATTFGIGIPPFDADNQEVVRLYEAAFSDHDFKKRARDLNENEIGHLGKKILEKFATELEAKPIMYNI